MALGLASTNALISRFMARVNLLDQDINPKTEKVFCASLDKGASIGGWGELNSILSCEAPTKLVSHDNT